MSTVNNNALKIISDQDSCDFLFRITKTFRNQLLISCIEIHTLYIESCILILVVTRDSEAYLYCALICVFCIKK